MTKANEEGGVTPFLTAFAAPRTGSDELPGRYCDARHVWVIAGDNGSQPMVSIAGAVGQTVTTTKVNVEMDDTDVGGGFELSTHTYVQAEADDVDQISTASLATTTRVLAERDDLDKAAGLLRLVTKTDAQMERDDTSVGLEMFEQTAEGRSVGLPVH